MNWDFTFTNGIPGLVCAWFSCQKSETQTAEASHTANQCWQSFPASSSFGAPAGGQSDLSDAGPRCSDSVRAADAWWCTGSPLQDFSSRRTGLWPWRTIFGDGKNSPSFSFLGFKKLRTCINNVSICCQNSMKNARNMISFYVYCNTVFLLIFTISIRTGFSYILRNCTYLSENTNDRPFEAPRVHTYHPLPGPPVGPPGSCGTGTHRSQSRRCRPCPASWVRPPPLPAWSRCPRASGPRTDCPHLGCRCGRRPACQTAGGGNRVGQCYIK